MKQSFAAVHKRRKPASIKADGAVRLLRAVRFYSTKIEKKSVAKRIFLQFSRQKSDEE
ncbi:hypothetical protein [uncultured Herbaspirillum sp.]|uniref:hypothetical protein n=1 Tax=uncultured Herbaspirillum sp. TaxID=160236 RepID=UPI0026392801|nr:hypothetical protein [uncultured Herbaspirillum sp.]